MDNATPDQPLDPQNPATPPHPQQPPYPQPATAYGQASPMSRLDAFRRQRPILAGAAALIAVCVVCALCGGVLSAMTRGSGSAAPQANAANASHGAHSATATAGPTATPRPTPTDTPTPKWTATQTFTGTGIKQTATFTTPDDWRIAWSCDPSSFYGSSYNLIVTVYNSDGSIADIAVNTICQAGNTSDYTEEHSGGSVYLEVNSEGSWQVQVQELK